MIKSLSFLLALFSASVLFAQGIQPSSELTVDELVRDVFIKGNCRNVSDISSLGNESLSIGEFTSGNEVISLSDGIIISTGDIDLAKGPNTTNEATFAFDIESIDPDLSQVASGTLFDVTGIEFDFVPIDDRVFFRYVFASEEYCEFVGTSFNDVFGFFVSGPGINGPFSDNAINVATLFGTDISVSINNVNHLSNSEFYLGNETNIDAEACNVTFNGGFQELIEYDGFTVPLVAAFDVIPCETYHIRLVIGDVGDPNLDSAVFLESNSFDLGEKTDIRVEVPGTDDMVAIENCANAQYVFTRNSSNSINEDCTVDFIISPESTAENGVDFEQIPTSITIPAGETEFILPINVLEDNITEGPEILKLEFLYQCDCIDPVVSDLIINESGDFEVNIENIAVCADQAFTLIPDIMGGVEPFEFVWNTGEQTEALETTISNATSFEVTITDFCNNSSTGVYNIGIQDIPSANLSGTFDLCEVKETGLPVTLEGNAPWSILYSINGVEQEPIDNIPTSPFFLETMEEGTYELLSFTDAYCMGNAVGSAVVEYANLDLEVDLVQPSCFNKKDGAIIITQLEAIEPFTIEWNIESDDNLNIQNITAGTYTLRIIDGNGCIIEKVYELEALSNDPLECTPLYIPNIFTPNNDGINDRFSIFLGSLSNIERVLSFQIYNRWGELVYEENNFVPENGLPAWNGNFKGEPVSTGVYAYKINVMFNDGSTFLKGGNVTLMR